MNHSVEDDRLRATIRNLLALSAIPEVRIGREPPSHATELVDLLIESLHLDFAFVRLCDPEMHQIVEATRGDAWNTFPEWLQQRLAVSVISRKEVVNQICGPEESCYGIVIPFGVNGERGLVAAACYRSDFPDQTDEQLLSLAANSAATAFRNANLINELRNAQKALRDKEQELRTACDEVEIRVADRTSELTRSVRELRDVLDIIPAIVWSALPDGANAYVNSRFVEYSDIPAEQLAGSGWHAATHPDDLQRHERKWLACVQTGNVFEDEVRFRRADGQYRWHLQRGVPLRDEDGNIVKWYGVVTDIEDRKRAEERIREQETELRQILDLAPQSVAVVGAKGERLFANRVLLEMRGLTFEEWRNRPTPDLSFLHPDDRERFARVFETDFNRGVLTSIEVRVRSSDGTFRWFLHHHNPLRDDHGRVTRWYMVGIDIDDRKRAEQKLQQENIALREEIDKASMFEEIVGASKPLEDVLSRIAKVARTDSTVLITGETGTGKELIARAVHKRSQRSGHPFVSVNCAALPPTLVSSELFGHEKGAFTGATQRRLGRFEMADGGTIFLDEVGELLPDTQASLLRVLQEREFERVGGGQPIRIDVRVIAATNRDLNAAVANGDFRQDLLYRLNVFPIESPPLRERKDDILMLVEYFVQRYANRSGRTIRSIDKKTLDLLQSYDWPGNIRELQNVIERSIILSSDDVFSVDELWLSKKTSQRAVRVEALPALRVEPRSEREIIEATLAETRGRVSGPSGAAAKLRIPPSTLETRIKALKINKQQFKFG